MQESDKATDTIKGILSAMGELDSNYDALYRRVAAFFGISSCELWIYYFLLMEADGATQRKISDKMIFPLQTVNSAVSALAKNGMVTLETDRENRRNKIIRLTESGRAFAKKTVSHLLQAEIRVTETFGEEKAASLNSLRAEYFSLLKAEFEGDFLKDS